ncbi:MAG: hypothetical protein AB1714_26885 [Acidobacteriota bacterium]
MKLTAAGKADRATLVGRFMTPLALLLGGAGLVWAELPVGVLSVCVGLLLFGAVFNLGFPRLLGEDSLDAVGRHVNIRLYLNLLVNTLLVYFLMPAFEPVWLILALTPIATAVYGSLKQTAANAAIVSVIVMGLAVLDPENVLKDWCEAAARVAFVLLISFMIHGLAQRPLPRTAGD